jgi:hypothetical protein
VFDVLVLCIPLYLNLREDDDLSLTCRSVQAYDFCFCYVHMLVYMNDCGAGLTLILHSYRKHGLPAFHVHVRRATSSAPFFYGPNVYQVPKCIEGCQCSMGTVFCLSGVSANG